MCCVKIYLIINRSILGLDLLNMSSQLHPSSAFTSSVKQSNDYLRRIAEFLIIVSCGLLPIIFIPSTYLPLSGGKIIFVSIAIALALLAYFLSVLKDGKMSFRLPLPIAGLWLIALVTTVSAFLSGDRYDAFFGNGLDSYTVSFSILMAVIATSMAILDRGQLVIRLYAVLIGSGLLLSLFHVIRFIFGEETLSFGLWNSPTVSPIGSWNGLAIFYGLVIILSLLALIQLPLTRAGKYIISSVVALALFMLAVVNFSSVWWVIAIVTGIIVLHNLVKNLWKSNKASSDSPHALIVAVIVLLFSITFLLGGARLGSFITDRLGVEFIEVRPSATATLEIARAVYQDNLWLGSGPNRFADSWRLHKDPSINQTIFWNAQFDSGYSYIFTSIIGNGLLGFLAWTIFLVSLVWSGIRFAFNNNSEKDNFWHFIGLSSLVASIYFWVMNLVYVPPPSILMLTAVTTGIFIMAYARSLMGKSINLSVEKSRSHGLVMIVLVVLIVVGSGYGVYTTVRHMAGVYEFNKAVSTISEGDTLAEIEARIAEAFQLSQNDLFAREIALYRLSEMRALLATEEPNANAEQSFSNAAQLAIQAAQSAVDLDSTDPYNHQVLGQVYAILATVGVEGANERALESFQLAKQYDPHSPVTYLLEAELAIQLKDMAAARTAAENAVILRNNYTEALFLLAQLDIEEGNTERAIAIVNAITQLEPENPARRYQLGILLASFDQLDNAIVSFEKAVELDPQYANARYFLALGYAEKGMVDEAIEQLTVVRDLSEGNSVVDDLIEQLRTTGSLSTPLTSQSPVSERNAEDGNVTEADLENDLVTSSNPVPENNEKDISTTE